MGTPLSTIMSSELCGQVRLKLSCSTTEASKLLDVATNCYTVWTANNKGTDQPADAQADLHRCCSHMT